MTRLSHVLLLLASTTSYSFLVAPPIPCSRRIGCRNNGCAYEQMAAAATPSEGSESSAGGMEKVLFVEVGFGNDQHGQDPTKACVRACRNAIEFNSIPSITSIVPGGYANMKLRVQLAVPVAEEEVDVDAIKKVFPYGQLLPVEFQRGGMRASSGIELPEMGDRGDDMIIAISCVTVGY